MPKFDATINGISLASYGVEPNMATVPQPDAKTYQAEIPGRDGLLDYTDAYGVVRYENRTVTIEAYEIGDIAARMEHRRAICSDMHGKTCTLALTTLPGYTFTGRCSVEYDEDGSETTYKLSFDCQPYMSAGERTFVGNCAGGVDLVFMSGDKPVKPRIEVPRRSIIIFNGRQYEVEAGTWTFDGIVFKRGRNELYINTYTEPGTTTWGDLQSMTWEQIAWHHKQSEASGALVNVTDALQARPNTLIVAGKSVQDGTPTPDAPIEVDVVAGPVTVQAVGKNIYHNEVQKNLSSAYIEVLLAEVKLKPNTVYTFSFIDAAGHKFYFNENLFKNPLYTTASGGREFVAVTTKDVLSYNQLVDGRWVLIKNQPDNTVASSFTDVMMVEGSAACYPYEPYVDNAKTITLPADHNYLASLPDGTRDDLVLRADGVAVLTESINKRVLNGLETWSYNAGTSFPFRLIDATLASEYRQLMCDSYIVRKFAATQEAQGITASPTNAPNIFCFKDTTIAQTVEAWKTKLATSNVTVYYKGTVPTTRYSADNGTTWSTTDPAAGTSVITLHKGTNNVWCTDALSPTIMLNYDTQERTRKQRISELYWRKNQPQRRLTWGQLATHTWAEIGSKPVQEWYYSGTADVVENAYINYEIGDL